MHRQPQQRETNLLSSGASLSGSKGLRGSGPIGSYVEQHIAADEPSWAT